MSAKKKEKKTAPAGKARKKTKAPRGDSERVLQGLRSKIDRIDDELLALLAERALLAQQVGRRKDSGGKVLHVPERERAILVRLLAANPGPLEKDAVEAIFREIFSASLALQRRLTVAYLGPETTYSHQAALRYFGKQPDFVAAEAIDEVFDEVERGRADYGVVPVENSTEGSVNQTLDRLVETQASICAEVIVPIHHHLLGGKGAGKAPTRIYSHPQVLAQCRAWLRDHHGAARLVPATSTGRAAQQAAREKGAAALASSLAAERYGLRILSRNCEDRADNRTRFLVLGRQPSGPSGADKTSLVLSVKDEPGVLYRILQPLARAKVSMTRIESRPARSRPWEYVFFIDLAGHAGEPAIARAIAEVEQGCRFVKILGAYPRAL